MSKLQVHLDRKYGDLFTMEKKNQEVTLPVDLATNKLSLDEIGSIFILMALPYLESDHGWDKNDRLKDIVDDFFKRGILTSTPDDDGGNNVEIDLDKV